MNFRGPAPGWDWPPRDAGPLGITRAGGLLRPGPRKPVVIGAPGVHTRNGDSVELVFDPVSTRRGTLTLGFAGGMEHLLHQALQAAHDRSIALGNEFGHDSDSHEESH